MIDGKMQDDATWKQAKVLVDLARLVAAKDPDNGGIIRLVMRLGHNERELHLTGRAPPQFRVILDCETGENRDMSKMPDTTKVSETTNRIRIAKYTIGQVVRHRLYPFRGVVFDIDPLFSNTEEWYQSIPAEVRPHKDQPYYHLFAENAETEYVAYVSEQNLLPDDTGEPVRHPQVAEIFDRDEEGGYRPRNTVLN